MGHIAELIDEFGGNIGNRNWQDRNPNSPELMKMKPNAVSVHGSSNQKVAYTWRMYKPSESRPYGRERSLSGASARSSVIFSELDEESTLGMSQIKAATMEIERPATSLGVALKMIMKEPIYTRLGKISLTVPSPMTIVEEFAMDSPTIPGRPPLHESCLSASENHSCLNLTDNAPLPSNMSPDENVESFGEENLRKKDHDITPYTPAEITPTLTSGPSSPLSFSSLKSEPSTPLSLLSPTLTINNSPKESVAQKPSSPTPPSPQFKSFKPVIGHNPNQTASPVLTKVPSSLTHMVSSMLSPISAWSSVTNATMSATNPPTNLSSKDLSYKKSRPFSRVSLKPRYMPGRALKSPLSVKMDDLLASDSKLHLLNHQKSDTSQVSEVDAKSLMQIHKRQGSEIRPSLKSDDCSHFTKKSHTSFSSTKEKNLSQSSLITSTNQSTFEVHNSSARSVTNATINPNSTRCTTPTSHSPKQHSFLDLPPGYSINTISQHLSPTELSHLQNQARTEVHRFHVLESRDVDSLSLELRALDERYEYLRKQHHNLRRSRKTVQLRVFSILHSPRSQNYSRKHIQKNEETLNEMDRNIGACVMKLEQAENRRTRIRQKLLEHLAAAAIMNIDTVKNDNQEENNNEICRNLLHTPSMAAGENTPPRSPQKVPESFEKLHNETGITDGNSTEVKEAIPYSGDEYENRVHTPLALFASNSSEILENLSENESDKGLPLTEQNLSVSVSVSSQRNTRTYADSDVYALMDSVEAEFERMGL